MSGLLLVAIAVGLGALRDLLGGLHWWIEATAVAGVMLLAGALVRGAARHRLWGTLAVFLAGVATITLLFAPGKAFLAVLPTFGTFDDLRDLQQAGLDSIAAQQAPAVADAGILYLVCLGVAGVVFAVDTLAFAFRAPAFTGLPLLVLLLAPTFVVPTTSDAVFFALTAAAWLAILLVRARPAGRRAAIGIGVSALVVALVVAAILPVPREGGPASGGGGIAAGINPVITLGDNLRRGDDSIAVTYTTTQTGGEYLRLAALDDFSGASWTPSLNHLDLRNDVAAVGPVPGLGGDIPVEQVTSSITVANIITRWLPVPYAPRSVTGLSGDWAWDGAALTIRSDTTNARGQVYQVTSVQPAPSIEQLVATGTTVEPGLDRYLTLPDDMPAVVAQTAASVVAGATTNYDKAIKLQDYFTGGLFTYSEDAPVKQGYDGSGASVLGAFLAAKSGYCVHFSSAMASMARTLGIPARVAVGFTPGTAVAGQGADATEYRVTTHDLHAWPELYFAGIGWVRFEPTPGRGVAPAFAPRVADDPATPNVDESKPVPAPTPTASAAAPRPSALPTEAPSTGTPVPVADAASPPPPSPWLVIVPLAALLLAPFVVRAIRRQRRIGLLARGSALAGWEELRDTADDLGLRTSDARTPRQLAADLAGHLDDTGAAALARLRTALEGEAFAERASAPSAADLRAVLRALRRDAGLARRIAAAVAPRSLFAGWLPQPAPVEPD